MNIQIFGTGKCFDTKKAMRYFKERKIPFQMIDMVEVDGSQYAVLVPLEEGSDEEEAIILKIVVDENGEEVLYDIEDDEEWEKVVDIWNDSQEG